MQILIIEDEEPAVRRLTKLLNEVENNPEVLGSTDSIESSVQWFEDNPPPDLVLMDIHLADGSSFEIFEYTDINCPVIFVTAYDEYAVKAFRVNAVDYLMKPVKKPELAQALEKVRSGEYRTRHEDLVRTLRDEGIVKKRNRRLIKVGQHIHLLDLDEAAYFYTQNKITFAVLPENRRYPLDESLEHLESVLDPKRYFRVNRQVIVGIDAIDEMYAYSKSRVKISLDPPASFDVVVSTERSPHFKSWLTGD